MPRRALADRPMTAAERQARRREQFRRMRKALKALRDGAAGEKAARIAAAALSDQIEADAANLR